MTWHKRRKQSFPGSHYHLMMHAKQRFPFLLYFPCSMVTFGCLRRMCRPMAGMMRMDMDMGMGTTTIRHLARFCISIHHVNAWQLSIIKCDVRKLFYACMASPAGFLGTGTCYIRWLMWCRKSVASNIFLQVISRSMLTAHVDRLCARLMFLSAPELV